MGAPRIAQDLSFLVLALGAGLYGLNRWGVDPTRMFTTSAVLTAVLAFAMQDTLGNVLGGVVLQIDNSLRVGDAVRLDDVSGTVVDVRWRYTAIETTDLETVVVPNSWLMKNRFRVIRPKGLESLAVRRKVSFQVDSHVPASRVMAVMNQAVVDAGIATVTALTDVECYRLEKQGFALVLMARPEIAQEIAAVIEQRQMGLSAAVDRALQKQADMRQEALLFRIKDFFGIAG